MRSPPTFSTSCRPFFRARNADVSTAHTASEPRCSHRSLQSTRQSSLVKHGQHHRALLQPDPRLRDTPRQPLRHPERHALLVINAGGLCLHSPIASLRPSASATCRFTVPSGALSPRRRGAAGAARAERRVAVDRAVREAGAAGPAAVGGARWERRRRRGWGGAQACPRGRNFFLGEVRAAVAEPVKRPVVARRKEDGRSLGSEE